MNRVFGILFVILLFLNSYYLNLIHEDYKAVRDGSLWDVDKARESYINGARYAFIQGCFKGQEWQDEVAAMKKQKMEDFDISNQANYCSRYWETSVAQVIQDEIANLGRRRYGERE